MRMILYTIIIALLFVVPVDKMDVAQLEPVEVVYVAKNKDAITLLTDTGAEGEGGTVEQALADLEKRTAGVVYLDTAEYLLLGEESEELIEDLKPLIKDSVRLCVAENPNMEIAAKYLKSHGDLPKLKAWKSNTKLPVWKDEKIIKKMENNA